MSMYCNAEGVDAPLRNNPKWSLTQHPLRLKDFAVQPVMR